MNPIYHFNKMRELIEADYEPGRARSLVITKLEEAELWLTKCEPTDYAKARDTSN